MTSMMMRRVRHAAGFAVATLPAMALAQAAPQQAAPQTASPKARERLGPVSKDAASTSAASPISESYPNAAVGDGVTAGGYNQSRWEGRLDAEQLHAALSGRASAEA